MKTCFIFLAWFILGVVVLLGLSNCNNSNLPTNGMANVDPTSCLSTDDLKDSKEAITDTLKYADIISGYSSTTGIIINGFKNVSFRINNGFIKAINSLGILDPSSSDSAWIMPAMEKVGNPDKNHWEVVYYFACYSQVDGNKGPAIYYKIPQNQNQSPLQLIPAQLAKDNIDSLYKYRKRYFQPLNIICPKGLGLPWCDMFNIYMSLDKANPEPKIKGIYAIENKTPQDSITLFLFTSKRPKSLQSSQTKKSSGKNASDEEEDGYYDFMFPCPNSCIP